MNSDHERSVFLEAYTVGLNPIVLDADKSELLIDQTWTDGRPGSWTPIPPTKMRGYVRARAKLQL